MPWLMTSASSITAPICSRSIGCRRPDVGALVDQVVRVRGAEHDGRLDGVVWQGRQ